MYVAYVCFDYFVKVNSLTRRGALTGLAIHITDGSELFYSLIKSVKYVHILRTHTQCHMTPRYKYLEWKDINMTKAAQLINNAFCDIDDGELEPFLNAVVWETVICQIHKKNSPKNTIAKMHQAYILGTEVILSYVMSGVSIVSLAPTLLYNAKHVSNWPLPKRILYNQVLTLFLSHFVTVIGLGANDQVIVCKIAGVLIHSDMAQYI